jgi:hypothetical protein
MKKLAILAAVAMVMAFATSGVASPPVPPPPEGFEINTTTSIECVGTVTETENYDWTYYYTENGAGAPLPIPDPPGGPGNPAGFNQAAQVRYTEDFQAINGFTQYNKSFGAATFVGSDEPNLEVDKDIGYIANTEDPLAQATMVERVGMNIVATGDVVRAGFSDLLALCPLGVTSAEATLPATNEAVAAGNTFKVTLLQNWGSNSQVTTTSLPELQHDVSAVVQDSFAGVGDISATFIVQALEAAPGYNDPAGNPIASNVSYTETATASGIWNFDKFMEYKSAINPRILPSFPTPFGNLPEQP